MHKLNLETKKNFQFYNKLIESLLWLGLVTQAFTLAEADKIAEAGG